MAILQDILALSVVTERFSRIATPGNVLQRYLGMEVGGKNVKQVQGRTYNLDVLDYRRSVAQGRAPGAPPAFIAPQAVGSQPVQLARTYEAIRLDYEKLLQIRSLGKNAGVQDRMGMEYYDAQLEELKRRQINWREVLIAATLRGTLAVRFDSTTNADVWTPAFSLGANLGYTIDFGIPAANKTQLNMLGGGNLIGTTWANTAATIVTDLLAVSAAFQNLVGSPLSTVIVSSVVWGNIIKNTQVINTAGSANTPFAAWDLTPDRAPDGSLTGLQTAMIRGMPWVKFIVMDHVLTVDGSDVKMIPDTAAVFLIEPNKSWFAFVEGSEIVKENPWSPPVERYGMVTWGREDDRPACVELHSLNNAITELKRPKGIAFGTVVF